MVCRYNCSSFKGGDEADLKNYRGITLLSIFGKFFLGVLFERLNTVVSNFEILEQNQIGFRKGYQTSIPSKDKSSLSNRFDIFLRKVFIT